MSEVINLNRARKARDKVAAVRQAETNRVLFGRTKTEKRHDVAEAARIAKELDGKKTEHPDDAEPS